MSGYNSDSSLSIIRPHTRSLGCQLSHHAYFVAYLLSAYAHLSAAHHGVSLFNSYLFSRHFKAGTLCALYTNSSN